MPQVNPNPPADAVGPPLRSRLAASFLNGDTPIPNGHILVSEIPGSYIDEFTLQYDGGWTNVGGDLWSRPGLSRKLRRCATGALSLMRPRALSRSMDCSSVRTRAIEISGDRLT
jgi:hypothetical protein